MSAKNIFLILIACLSGLISSRAQTLDFSGYTWEVRGGDHGGPGPNYWSATNAWVDAHGWLHLLISQQDGRWLCPELTTEKSFGFGRYDFEVAGRADRLDRNVVLGLFTYPPPEIGPDRTCELDIEFARWGKAAYPNGNYTVWPASRKVDRTGKKFEYHQTGELTTQRFTWTASQIVFESFDGLGTTNQPVMRWPFQPADAAARINRHPLPVHLNLWCFAGRPPTDGQPVEFVIRRFRFQPLP